VYIFSFTHVETVFLTIIVNSISYINNIMASIAPKVKYQFRENWNTSGEKGCIFNKHQEWFEQGTGYTCSNSGMEE